MLSSPSKALSIVGETIELERDEALLRGIASQLAREIADPADIAKAYGITMDTLYYLQELPVFKAILVQETKAWIDADNTPDRIKLKYLSMIEQSAPEFFAALVDTKVALKDRTDLLKTLMKGANIGNDVAIDPRKGGAPGARVSISINLGNDQRLSFKDITPQVIDNTINQPKVEQSATIEYVEGVFDDEEDEEESV